MCNRNVTSILVALSVAAISSQVWATGVAPITKPASVGMMMFELSAGSQLDATIEQVPGDPDSAQGLQHTILDVFLDPEDVFVQESASTSTTPASIHLAPYPDTHAMRLVARSDHAVQLRYQITVHLTFTDPSNQTAESTSTFVVENTSAGTLVMQDGLAANTHIGTAMQPGGSNDTLIMVLNGDQVVQYDDDDGVGLMSWLHLWGDANGTSPCAPGGSCSIFVANVLGQKDITSPTKGTWSSNVAEGAPTRLFWDEDVHNGKDADSDGVGDALETILGTYGAYPNSECPTDINLCKDSDQDGILDTYELGGIPDDPAHESNPWNILMFSAYGADPHPTHKDVFVETHWLPFCSGPNCPNKNFRRFTSIQVDSLRQRWLPFYVHIDTGDPSCTPADVCGDWGGASIFPDGYTMQGDCDGFSLERVGYFHDLSSDDGASTWVGTRCSSVSNVGYVGLSAHELGHQFGLDHYGGEYDALDQISGCKPHYVSMMNYAYQESGKLGDVTAGASAPGFSLGLNSIAINAAALDESSWSSISTQYGYADAINDMFGRKYQNGVGIDWNMDGHISTSGVVQGPLNYVRNNALCDRAPFAAREGGKVMQASDPSLVVANGGLWMVGRDGTSGFLAAEGAFTCATVPGADPCDSWSNSIGIVTSPVSPGPYAAAGAGDVLAFVSDTNDLYFITQPPWQGQGTPSAPQLVGSSGGPKVWGHPIATVDPATQVVSIYAAGGAAGQAHHLMRWDYDPGIAGWSRLGDIQYYDTGAPIEITETVGPGLTRGYQQGGLGPQETQGEFVYLILVVPDTSIPGPPGRRATILRQVTATWQNPTVQYWTELPQRVLADLAQSLVAPFVSPGDGRVAIAFRPEPQSTDSGPGVFVSGRFYMTFQGLGTLSQSSEPWASFTQGNVFWDGTPATRPSEREMVMVPVNNFYNEWQDYPNAGLFLTYFDGNVRGTVQADWAPNNSIFPNADGVINMDQHDYDDQAKIAKNLACSLFQSCPP